MKVAVGKVADVAVGKDIGVGEDARVAVAEEMIVGEAFGLGGIAVGMTGCELQATLASNNNKLTNCLRRIWHLIKRGSLLALYVNPHYSTRHILHA